METEAHIELDQYLERAPNPAKNKLRYEWHLERYRFAAKYMQKIERIADVGCGWGFGTEYLNRFGKRVHGFEINPRLVSYASKRFQQSKAKFVVHNILDGPLPEAPYDLICMFEVIEHLEDPNRGLENLKLSLSNKGALVLSTPNFVFGKRSLHPHHAIEFSYLTLKPLLRSHFCNIRYFSQGNGVQRKTYETKLANNIFLNRLRLFDSLNLRRFLPIWMKRPLMDRAIGISQNEILRETINIREEWHVDSRWLLAACSNQKVCHREGP